MMMTEQHKTTNKRTRLIAEILLIAGFVLAALWILKGHTPKILELLKDGNVDDIEQYIRQAGNSGRIILVVLQIVETVSIVLPAMPVYICAGAVFGKVQGFLLCYITNVVMNVLIFLGARRLKASSKGFSHLQRNPKLEEWLQKATRMDRVVFMMCLLPIVPNGMIPYMSAQTRVTLRQFTVAISLGCIPSIFMYVVCGDFLLSEHFKVTLPLVVAIAACVCLIMVFRKRVTSWMEPKIKRFIGIQE